jgi:hypothetical protein
MLRERGEVSERSRMLGMLLECRAHVFRQQTAGVHEQDRHDAVELYPRLAAALKEWS